MARQNPAMLAHVCQVITRAQAFHCMALVAGYGDTFSQAATEARQHVDCRCAEANGSLGSLPWCLLLSLAIFLLAWMLLVAASAIASCPCLCCPYQYCCYCCFCNCHRCHRCRYHCCPCYGCRCCRCLLLPLLPLPLSLPWPPPLLLTLLLLGLMLAVCAHY